MSNRRALVQAITLGRAVGDQGERVGDLERASQLSAFGLEYAYVTAGDTLPAGPTAGIFYWDMAAPSGAGAGPFTNAPDTFSIQTETIAAGAGHVNSGDFRGLSIDKPGMYVAFKNILILSLYNDTTLRAITLYEDTGNVGAGDMVFGDQNHVSQGHGQHMELWEIGFLSAPPTGAILLASGNGESSSYACRVTMLVIRIDTEAISL